MANELIRFKFNSEKFVNAVVYFALKCPGLSKLKICKLLYFADKEHLLRYGRPIIGDSYYKLPYGPVPTRGLDILNRKAEAGEVALLEKYISMVGNNIFPKRSPEKKVFSKSDLETLDAICEKYGDFSAIQLTRLSHKETSWIETKDSHRMDYALFFEGLPTSKPIKKLVESEQESRDLLRKFSVK